jgi:hypothetical protein
MTVYKEMPGAPQHASFPTVPSRVACCLPEYFMYYNYLKSLGARQPEQRTFVIKTFYETNSLQQARVAFGLTNA